LIDELKERGGRLGLGVSVESTDQFKKRKRLIALDMDGTLVSTEVINELAKLAGVEEEVKTITEDAMEGKIPFEEALRRRVSLLKGLSVNEINKLKEKIPLAPGAYELTKELKKAGFVTALITGSLDVIANYIGEKLGFDYVMANKLVVKEGKLTGEVESPIIDAKSKLDALREICKREGIPLDECIAVGDGANDLLIVRDAGLGVGVNPRKVLRGETDAYVSVRDLKALLALIAESRMRKDIRGKL
jgi:phosphoserine phosphatase